MFSAAANAAGMIKDYHAYRIKNQNIRTVVPVADEILSKEGQVKKLARVVKEAARLSHSLPENYDLKANSSMRILCLKFKDDSKPLQFTIKKQGQTYQFSY